MILYSFVVTQKQHITKYNSKGNFEGMLSLIQIFRDHNQENISSF